VGRIPLHRVSRWQRRSSAIESGTALARYFPDMVAQIQGLEAKRFVLDGELVIPIGDVLSFDELQLRLHPAASRVQKLLRRKIARASVEGGSALGSAKRSTVQGSTRS
jgi:hypothetical protein